MDELFVAEFLFVSRRTAYNCMILAMKSAEICIYRYMYRSSGSGAN